MEFQRLPDEVCLKILQFVPQDDLCVLMMVCRRWKRLCSDSALWRSVKINCAHPNWLDRLSRVASLHPKIRCLALFGNNNIYHPPVQRAPTTEAQPFPAHWVWTDFECLESLKLHFCQREVVDLVPEIVRHCPLVTALACEGSLDFSIGTHLTHAAAEGRRFTELSFAHSASSLDDTSVSGAMRNMTLDDTSVSCAMRNVTFSACIQYLRTLNLDGIPLLTDEGALRLLEHCPCLTTLALDGEQLTDTTACFVGDCFSQLRSFSISFCNNLTDASLNSFCNLKNLHTLMLKKGPNFSDDGFARLFGALDPTAGGSCLRNLSLVECNDLLDTSVKALARHCPALVHLDLSWCCHLTDDCLEVLVARCRHIRSLKLVGLRSAQCTAILGSSMDHLRHLDLTQCHLVSDSKLQDYKQSKPLATIINFWGEIVDV